MAGTSSDVRLPDIEVLRQIAREELSKKLQSVRGVKDLVLDSELMKPLDRVAGASLLKENGVGKIYKLENSKTIPGSEKRIYMIRANPTLVKTVADQINAERTSNIARSYKILLVPRRLHVCELILEREGVYGYVDIDEFPLDLIVLDKDVLSLEAPPFFRSFFLEGDETGCHQVARSLVTIQEIFRNIPNVYCLGRCAQMVNKLMNTMLECSKIKQTPEYEIGHLFLVDRDCDFVTPLCSQVTYEGLLDDTFGIASGFIEFGSDVTGKDQSAKLLLTSHDMIFEDIRDRHFSNVSCYLSSKAKELQTGYDKRHTLSSVNEMKDFVAKDLRDLKQQHRSLSLHVGACEKISKGKTESDFSEMLRTEHCLLEGIDMKACQNHIEEMIIRQQNMSQCLRLLCLLSVTQGGLSTDIYKSFKKHFVQSFGFDQLLTLYNLKRVGLFAEAEKTQAAKHFGKMAAAVNIPLPCPFRSICKRLNLVPKSAEDVNLRNPNDMSYVFSGAYTPMLCKIIEQVLIQEGMAGSDELEKLLAVPVTVNAKAKSVKGRAISPASRVALVYFLGGCTYSEITALRFLAKQRGYKILIATTGIISGKTFLNSVSETVL